MTRRSTRLLLAATLLPACAPGADHAARDDTLPPSAAAEVDRLLATIETGRDPGGEPRDDHFIGGWMTFVVNDGRRSWPFFRIAPGETLGRLKTPLQPPA